MRRITPYFLTSLFFVFGCAGGSSSLLEETRFLLDQCNPSDESTLENCSDAVAKMDELQEDEPGNIESATLEFSAYTGLAGVDFLNVASRLSGLVDNDDDDFVEFRNFINDLEEDNGRELVLADLLSSQTALSDVLDDLEFDVNDENENAFFQLGIIQAVDSFMRPVKIAGSNAGNVGDIGDDDAAVVENDLLDFDNNLEASGTDDDDILRPVRETYCRCTLNVGSYTAACLRDVIRCSLLDADAEPEGDYNDDGTPNALDCVTLTDPDGLTACGGDDTD